MKAATERKAGIYAIVCTPNGLRYIGASADLAARRKFHMTHLRKGTHVSPRLRSLRAEHPFRAFKWVVLEESEPGPTLASRLRDAELRWHDRYRDVAVSSILKMYPAAGDGAESGAATRVAFRAMCRSRGLHPHLEIVKAMKAHMDVLALLPSDPPPPEPKKRKGK